ncbi:MAG: flagellar basal-body MS-ring/collar protein FliF, partial [Sphingomonadaceae bacterium]|nr:flagellar basal-body MS-ring/collar protein FliF [Sphingomonadaceae bacterium]
AAISAPPQRVMFAGLPDEEKAAVVVALNASGIDYGIASGGGITVSEDNYHQARMLLASQGLPKSAPGGDEIVSSLPLGASRAVEGEKLRSAKELDLSRTIEAIDSVQSARVHLALDTPSVFLRDRSRRAASVMLRLAPGRALGDGQVQAIVHLVASSVPGLAPDSVSVVDQSGKLLSSGSGENASTASDRQVAVQTAIETRYLQALNTLLTPIVGPGNFTAEVHADVDFSEVQATREDFPQASATIAREERTWTGAGDGAQQEAGGIPGAMSNQAPTAASVAAAPGGTMATKQAGTEEISGNLAGSGNYKRNYALGREVSVTKKPTGDITRLTVAVAIRNPENADPLSKKDLQSIEALVKGAVGYTAARGDVVALNALSFAPIEESALEQWYEATWISPAIRTTGGVVVAALAVFGIGLPLLRRKGMMPGAPSLPVKASKGSSEAAKIAASMEKELAAAFAQRPRPDPADVTLSMIEAAPSYEARAVLIRNFVRENPARAALVVRDLLKGGKTEGVSKVG